jgi:hypothetical protein
MCAFRRHLRTLLLALTLCALPRVALAWVETSTVSHVVTLDIERDGTATVAHEILIKVRGGPLNGFDIAGVDADAVPLPDATVAPAESGGRGATAYPLLLDRRDDGSLKVEIDHPKGVSRGTYVFKLRYRTDLAERDLIRPTGSMVEVRWVGPRPPDGIDSARVVFRLPPATIAPRLPELDPTGGDDPGGVFLSSLRRGRDKDELEVIRPHVAKGEPVVWRVLTSPKAFEAFAPPETEPAFGPLPSEPVEAPRARLIGILVLFAVALGYAAVVLWKWRLLARAARARSARPRALLPLYAPLRAALAGAALAAAVAVGARTTQPTLAGVLLVVAIALALHVSPLPLPVPKKPGRWLPLSDEDAFGARERKLPGRLLDAGTVPGFFAFLGLLAGFAGGASYVFQRSPYHGLLLALGSASLLPVFCTGRGAELPADGARRPARLLAWLAGRLRGDASSKVVAWARIPNGADEADELRLLVMPRRPLAGLGAIEFGLEYQSGVGGPVALPWVMVRALDGSPAHGALPRSVVWTRGRKPEERAAVLRPKLPTRGSSLALIRSIVSALSERGKAPTRRQPAIKLAMSSGKGSSRAKPGMVSSPAQAT